MKIVFHQTEEATTEPTTPTSVATEAHIKIDYNAHITNRSILLAYL